MGVVLGVIYTVSSLVHLVMGIVGHNQRVQARETEARQNEEAKKQLEAIKAKYEYQEGCFHIAVVGKTSAGKSSLINAIRGILDGKGGAAETGDGETTQAYTRYVDPRTSKLVWYDIPGSGTSNHPSWEYFSKQSLFLFDAILVMVEATIMETDIDLIKMANDQKPPIPTHVIRTKSDTHILSALQDAGHFDASDLPAVALSKTVVASNALAAAKLEVQKAGLPANTRFYQVNKHTLHVVVVGDEGSRGAHYRRFQIDEEVLLQDLMDDVKRRAGRL